MTKPWFRFYRKTVNNPKAQRLRPELFKAWVNILCSTDNEGRLPTINDLAFTLRIAESKVRDLVQSLVDARLLRDFGAEIIAHDWNDHNYDSDADPTATERKRKSRSVSRVTPDYSHANATRTDTDSDEEQNKQSEPSLEFVGSASAKPQKRAARFSTLFVTTDWLPNGEDARLRAGLNPIDLAHELARFEAYFTSDDCTKPLKKNWHQAWLRWCIHARGTSNGSGFNGAHRPTATAQTVDKIFSEIADARAREHAGGTLRQGPSNPARLEILGELAERQGAER